MTPHVPLFCLIATTLVPLPVLAQVANVYVATPKSEIYAYDASSTGKLTLIKGSPVPATVNTAIVVNGKYLFGIDKNQSNVDSWLIESDGALKKNGTTNVTRFDKDDPGGQVDVVGTIFLDHTGATLYAGIYDGWEGPVGNPYEFFNIEKGTGELNYTGQAQGSPPGASPLTFTGNNDFAYGAFCWTGRGSEIRTYTRHNDGALVEGVGGEFPEAPSGDAFCAGDIVAADSTGHLAFSFQAQPPPLLGDPNGDYLGAYSTSDKGNLTTTSTYKNMAMVAGGAGAVLGTMSMSPSGKLLAVTTGTGVQIFHFNGAKPVTKFTEVIGTSGWINQIQWDNDNHLYAINGASGKLHVYTVTTASAVEAHGSPYTIPGGAYDSTTGEASILAVQTLPR